MIKIEREIDGLNIAFNYTQGKRYRIYAYDGMQIGWILERSSGFTHAIRRQVIETHRPFIIDVFDMHMNLAFTITRGFRLINSDVDVVLPLQSESSKLPNEDLYDSKTHGLIIGSSIGKWHLWKRRYTLFALDDSAKELCKFAKIDSPITTWDFVLKDSNGNNIATAYREFSNLVGRVVTDTGLYFLNFNDITLNARAVMIANIISVDFDYFSKRDGNSRR